MERHLRTTKEQKQHEIDHEIEPRASFQKHFDISKYSFSPNQNAEEATASQTKYLTSLKPIQDRKRKNQMDANDKSRKITRSKRRVNGYAPPTMYAHLPELRDILSPDLICVFVGLNPGITTAKTGHAFAHPSNLFWKLLHSSGCTPRRCHPSEDGELPKLFALGITNIVSRPTRNSSELKNAEMDAGVNVLNEKISRFHPEVVCIVGKSIWQSIWRTKHGRNMNSSSFRYGWQDESERMGIEKDGSLGWKGASVFVACSTSGLAATLKPAEKESIWKELGTWVKWRRELHDLKRGVAGVSEERVLH